MCEPFISVYGSFSNIGDSTLFSSTCVSLKEWLHVSLSLYLSLSVWVCVYAYVCVPNPELEGCVGRSVLCRYKLISRIQTLGAGKSYVLQHRFMKGGKLVYSRVCLCECDVSVGWKERDGQKRYNDTGILMSPSPPEPNSYNYFPRF